MEVAAKFRDHRSDRIFLLSHSCCLCLHSILSCQRITFLRLISASRLLKRFSWNLCNCWTYRSALSVKFVFNNSYKLFLENTTINTIKSFFLGWFIFISFVNRILKSNSFFIMCYNSVQKRKQTCNNYNEIFFILLKSVMMYPNF